MESNFIKYDDNWSNGSGYTKEDLISKINNAKETILDRTGKKNNAQAQYDEANSRNCSGCGGRKQPSCHDRCWAKESDKANRANDIRVYQAEIDTANANIVSWQADLEVLREEEANARVEAEAKRIADEEAKRIADAEAKRIAEEQSKSKGGTTTTTTTGGGSTTTRGGGTNTSTGGGSTTNTSSSSSTPNETKSKTGLYIGIGVGVLALGIITFAVLTRK